MKEIIIASSNQGKLAEFQQLLAPIVCISQGSLGISDVAETGLSFVENALIKARHASRITKRPALADDSGLVVSALGGKPGIYTARYAGESASDSENIALLLEALKNTAKAKRGAFFYSSIVFVEHEWDPMPIIACGQIAGVILDKVQGKGGFGYDPVFYLPDLCLTLAEVSAEVKNSISHRARAFQQLKNALHVANIL